MHLPNLQYLPILLPILLSASSFSMPNPNSNSALKIRSPYTLQPRTFDNSDRFSMGPFNVFILKSIAVLPINLAATEMADFFTVVAQAGSIQKLAGRVTDHYDFGLGAIKMFLNTLPEAPNEAAPPLNWDLVMWIGSQLLEMTNLGWTDHFAAVFVDSGTQVQTFVTLQVISAGLTTIGFVDPDTGQPTIPAIDYFRGSR